MRHDVRLPRVALQRLGNHVHSSAVVADRHGGDRLHVSQDVERDHEALQHRSSRSNMIDLHGVDKGQLAVE